METQGNTLARRQRSNGKAKKKAKKGNSIQYRRGKTGTRRETTKETYLPDTDTAPNSIVEINGAPSPQKRHEWAVSLSLSFSPSLSPAQTYLLALPKNEEAQVKLKVTNSGKESYSNQ